MSKNFKETMLVNEAKLDPIYLVKLSGLWKDGARSNVTAASSAIKNQLMVFSWKYLIPFSLVNIFIISILISLKP